MRKSVFGLLLGVVFLTLQPSAIDASTLLKQVPGLTLLSDVEYDLNVRTCLPSTPEAACSLTPSIKAPLSPHLDIKEASVLQAQAGESRVDRVTLNMALWAKVPLRPSEPYISYFWESGGPCLSDSHEQVNRLFQLVWDGSWSAHEGAITNCDPSSLVEGAAVPFVFANSRQVVRLEVALGDLVPPNTSVRWHAGVRLIPFNDSTYTNSTAVDLAPDTTAFNPTPPPEYIHPQGEASFRSLLSPTEINSEINTVAPAFLQLAGGSGMAIAVVTHNQIADTFSTYSYNYGTLSKTSPQPITNTSIFEIGSLTKLFTGIMAARYVESGKFSSLSAPLSDYLPATVTVPSFDGTPITLQNLADHSSALRRNPTANDTFYNPNPLLPPGYFTNQELYGFVSSYTLPWRPGTQYLYSNLAFALLGIAEERAGNGVWNSLEKTSVSIPLGMSDTQVKTTGPQQPRVVQGYANGNPQPHFANAGGYVAMGALRSTSSDLAKFLQASMSPPATPLGQAMITAEAEQSPLGIGPCCSEGLGWDTRGNGQPDETLSKDGATNGFNAYIWFQKNGSYGFVFLVNAEDTPDTIALANTLSAFFNGN